MVCYSPIKVERSTSVQCPLQLPTEFISYLVMHVFIASRTGPSFPFIIQVYIQVVQNVPGGITTQCQSLAILKGLVLCLASEVSFDLYNFGCWQVGCIFDNGACTKLVHFDPHSICISVCNILTLTEKPHALWPVVVLVKYVSSSQQPI